MSIRTKILDFDMVYVPTGKIDFKNVHVDGIIEEEMVRITIYADSEISENDLATLIVKLQQDTLSKMKLNIVDDCVVYVSIDGTMKNVDISVSEANESNLTVGIRM